jgi:acyl dehydratase
MEISSRFKGMPLRPYKAEITARQAMNFAASVDDPNPHYFDDERDNGIVVPPMYAIAFTWPVIERIWEYIEDSEFPVEVLMTMVHYTEHLRFHKTMKPGETLELSGKIASIAPHRAGTVATISFHAADPSGAPVFTEHIGALLRGVSCPDAAPSDEKRDEAGTTAESGGPIWENTVYIDPMAPYIYDGCTNIHFPIHTSRSFARQAGLAEPIYQGSATLTRAVREILEMEGHSDPGLLREVSCRFSGMVVPGTDIRTRLLSRGAGGVLSFDVVNNSEARVIKDGRIRLGAR